MSGDSDLAAQVADLAKATVLCVGDVMLDRFVYGTVERISPEAPIPVFSTSHETEMLGGAGNVARNLVALGARVCFVSAVGDDAAGRAVTALIGELDNVDARIVTDKSRRTSIKTRYIAGAQQMMRADDESVGPPGADIRKALLAAVKARIDEVGAVVLSDYAKGVLDDGIALEIIELAKAAGKFVVVDPQGGDYARYRGADLVTPNRKELALATGTSAESADEITTAARGLIAEAGFGAVLATLGGDGMALVLTGEVHALEAEARDVFDVSGAGDTVVAVVAAARAAGLALIDAAELANVAAGIVVAKVGTAVAYADDIAGALHHRQAATGEAKIVAAASAAEQARQWRGQGLAVGFTNGCFDLLHPGHISLMREARAACDRLIVGLNSDSSTRRLKGEGRPVQTEGARAQVLASLESVDMVVIFSEDVPAALVEAIRPEVFVKGADYRIEDIPEAKIVEGYGGKIVLARIQDGHSTTSTIARLAGDGNAGSPKGARRK